MRTNLERIASEMISRTHSWCSDECSDNSYFLRECVCHERGRAVFRTRIVCVVLMLGVRKWWEEEDGRMQAARVNAGSKVLVRTEFPTLDAGYEA